MSAGLLCTRAGVPRCLPAPREAGGGRQDGSSCAALGRRPRNLLGLAGLMRKRRGETPGPRGSPQPWKLEYQSRGPSDPPVCSPCASQWPSIVRAWWMDRLCCQGQTVTTFPLSPQPPNKTRLPQTLLSVQLSPFFPSFVPCTPFSSSEPLPTKEALFHWILFQDLHLKGDPLFPPWSSLLTSQPSLRSAPKPCFSFLSRCLTTTQ